MIEIIASGPLNSVQDLGRRGYRNIGVATAGAMDPVALRVGNLMLGNADNCAAIEIQTFPFKVRFTRTLAIALTGADCKARLDGQPMLPLWACTVQAGQELELSFPKGGARGYLCVSGGIDVPVLMGSRSTSLRGNFGGHEGRTLTAGDTLAVLEVPLPALPAAGFGVTPPGQALRERFPVDDDGALLLRAIPAGEYALFQADAERFWAQSWKISAQSNRTGYRLSGLAIQPETVVEMRSYGLVPGIVQVPPAGEPIIQMSDANTAGGYPKIAGIIEVDLWRLGQAPIGSRIRLVKADTQDAIAAEQALEGYLQGVGRMLQALALR
ncbi:biotin-dependent carboxyltransferase family protein [Pseudomonas sp. CFBP 13711]|uniref:5-oxoprolinase/urea amidolyase family protein n=1 Tax=unclassified Pseudomonas TaxID=196821 RepID=UPI001781BF09|nr:biotin-dependent carboxyltransferase family protein [Pseudomonas sp. CFBP 13711]MBD8715005.1 biotin-dependent carboxyltransferase family protein [Pseudomonas sp. CFBP 13715]